MAPASPALHVVVRTHTTRHLAGCLAGLTHQSVPADTVTLSIDGEGDNIASLAEAWVPRLAARRVAIVTRPHTGEWRIGQVYNNGIRAIIESGGQPDDQVVFLDGDMVLLPEALETHRRLANEANLVIAFRIPLDRIRTAIFDAEAWATGRQTIALTPDDRQRLLIREARYDRHIAMRRNPFRRRFLKAHKPKIIGCHHAVNLGRFVEVNGYDEGFTGYGGEDDDLGRRLYARDPGIAVSQAITKIPAIHLHHDERESAWDELPGIEIFKDRAKKGVIRASEGLDNPRQQDTPVVRWLKQSP